MARPPARRQSGVALMVLLAGAGTVAVAWVALAHGVPLPLYERLARLGGSLAIIALCLAVAVGRVAQLRFSSAADFDAAVAAEPASPGVLRAQAMLQNTLEQAVLAALAQTALALAIDFSAALIAALTGLFVTGRVLFALGYARGAEGRALGFALTFYPSVLALLLVVATLVERLF